MSPSPPAAELVDFDLTLQRLDTPGSCTVRVECRHWGKEGTANVDTAPLLDGCSSPGSRPGNPPRDVEAARTGGLKDLGRHLYRHVFANEPGRIWSLCLSHARMAGLRLRLRLRLTEVPELAALPWECLFDPDEHQFMALVHEVVIIRVPKGLRLLDATPIEPPWRILLALASPPDMERLDIERERYAIESELAALQSAGQVHLEVHVQPSWKAISQRLTRPRHDEPPCHVLHFVGHGGFDPESQDGRLAFVGADGLAEWTYGSQIELALTRHRSLRLLVLNACATAQGAPDDAFSGLAQGLAYQTSTALVAMQFRIHDRTAIDFSTHFYRSLATEPQVDLAMAEARLNLSLAGSQREWATPVLFLRSPTGALFSLPEPPAEPASAASQPGQPPAPVPTEQPLTALAATAGQPLQMSRPPLATAASQAASAAKDMQPALLRPQASPGPQGGVAPRRPQPSGHAWRSWLPWAWQAWRGKRTWQATAASLTLLIALWAFGLWRPRSFLPQALFSRAATSHQGGSAHGADGAATAAHPAGIQPTGPPVAGAGGSADTAGRNAAAEGARQPATAATAHSAAEPFALDPRSPRQPAAAAVPPEPSPECRLPAALDALPAGILRFRKIGPGTFQMGTERNAPVALFGSGDRKGTASAADEAPAHEVTLSAYCMQMTEVTQALWKAVMHRNPSHDSGDAHPVDTVSWGEAQKFVARLNVMAGGALFRLPTEAEWELAARAGTTGRYSFGNDPRQLPLYGNCRPSGHPSARHSREAASLAPNPLGLYDLYGNVEEWVEDAYGAYTAEPETDPHRNPPLAESRVLRGGSWDNDAGHCRSASRDKAQPDYANARVGFRLVRILPPPP